MLKMRQSALTDWRRTPSVSKILSILHVRYYLLENGVELSKIFKSKQTVAYC